MRFVTDHGDITLTPKSLTIAGWTGRDRAAVQHHIDELAELGVAPPSQVPLFYRATQSLLTQADTIQVVGPATSGEVEPLILQHDGIVWLGLGSDHTDRELETVSVAASKQACAKPVGHHLWPMADVQSHLDDIRLSCEILEQGEWTLYQSGTLAQIQPIPDLIAGADLQNGSVLLCGTLGAQGGVRPAQQYRMALTDPVLDRQISLEYRVQTLPIIA
jgi:hypothetical protein